MEFSHYSVLLQETIDELHIRPDGIYVDGTLGGGGHAFQVCSRFNENGHFYGIDQDAAAIEAADIVLMDDDPLKISKAIHISRKCIHIVYENIYFAIGIKVLFLLLGAIGIANMWMAIFADVGVMILAVLNAIRALFVRNL